MTEGRAPPKAPRETPPPSDAFVFFGATGDLAYKKIFPALHDVGGLARPT